ncbi:hypothetical protein LI82_00250 [Methanococcoides methylutens]|uniref:DUF61 family protein n=1 Tax=Methanococcoides methylutens TaxID=2226 RepID=A0A099T6D1_METMT|nr:DUF61 family protein [Methanococcoides methylutens]KGK99693.1 hypothetical protein LI82_00250 [Methanococcoides methylutens]
MSGRLPDPDDSGIMRWMRLEVGKINKEIVAERKTLSQLLKEEIPSSKTKGGNEHLFDKKVLTLLEEQLPAELHGKLRLPILFFLDNRVTDSSFLNDETAARSLQILGELSKFRSFSKGRLWVGKSIAYSIMRKYPIVVQIVMG